MFVLDTFLSLSLIPLIARCTTFVFASGRSVRWRMPDAFFPPSGEIPLLHPAVTQTQTGDHRWSIWTQYVLMKLPKDTSQDMLTLFLRTNTPSTHRQAETSMFHSTTSVRLKTPPADWFAHSWIRQRPPRGRLPRICGEEPGRRYKSISATKAICSLDCRRNTKAPGR